MEQAQFEQSVLRMAHSGGVQRLTPAAVAYQLRVSVKDAERMLDKMVTNAHLELDSDDDGNLFYFVPGLGTPGIFMTGTAAANPIEAPKPPDPDPSRYHAPQGPPPGPMPGSYGAAQMSPPGQAGPQGNQPPYGAYAPPTGAPQYAQPYGRQYGAPPQGAPPQGAPPQGAPRQGAPPQANPYGPSPGAQYPPPANPQQYGAQQYGAPPYGQPYGQSPQGFPQQAAYGAPYPGQAAPYGQGGFPQQPYQYGHNALVPVSPTGPKSPAAASLLSAMIPGAGQLYNGQVGKGLSFFFLTCFLLAAPPLAVVPWLWGVIDAFNTSKQQNQQQHYGLLGP